MPIEKIQAHNTTSHPSYVIGVLQGEGIGSEVIAVTLQVLAETAHTYGFKLDLRDGPEVANDQVLNDEITDFFDNVFAANGPVLCGPVGGRFVYELRRHFDLYYKLVPLHPLPDCSDLGALKPDRTDDVDVLIVRENTSGLYFGEWGYDTIDDTESAYHRFGYRRPEVERVIRVAAEHAAKRRGHLCLTVKTGGIPTISALWRKTLEQVTQGMGLTLQVLEIDNITFQLINNAQQFDVIVTPNMFGDVLGDCGALLLGGRGLSFSGNFNATGDAVYQTAHGAAYDLEGTGRANPVGQILSAAMLLRESYGLQAAAAGIEAAVARVLASGIRTADIAKPSHPVIQMQELSMQIVEAIAEVNEDREIDRAII